MPHQPRKENTNQKHLTACWFLSQNYSGLVRHSIKKCYGYFTYMYATVIGDHDAVRRFITDTQAYSVCLQSPVKILQLNHKGSDSAVWNPPTLYLQTMIILLWILSVQCAVWECSFTMALFLWRTSNTFHEFSRCLVLLWLEEGPLVVECGDESLERTKR